MNLKSERSRQLHLSAQVYRTPPRPHQPISHFPYVLARPPPLLFTLLISPSEAHNCHLLGRQTKDETNEQLSPFLPLEGGCRGSEGSGGVGCFSFCFPFFPLHFAPLRPALPRPAPTTLPPPAFVFSGPSAPHVRLHSLGNRFASSDLASSGEIIRPTLKENQCDGSEWLRVSAEQGIKRLRPAEAAVADTLS